MNAQELIEHNKIVERQKRDIEIEIKKEEELKSLKLEHGHEVR
jgi:hypothetical protein